MKKQAKSRVTRRRVPQSGGVTNGGSARVAAQSTTRGRHSKKVLKSSRAGAPVGPYSQGIQVGNFIFVAGEKGLDAKTGKIVTGGIEAETRQALENIKAILAKAGASLDDAVACTVYMTSLKGFEQMNGVYAEYFRHAPPGRTTVEVSALPAGAQIEITVTAVI